MSRPGHDGELTFILGPPAEPALRRYFDDYQSAFQEDREEEVRRYQALEKELLDEIFVGSGAEQASVFAELLGGALGAAVRLRQAACSTAFMKGLWVSSVMIRSEDVEFLAGGLVVRFPPGAKTCQALAASLGLVLKRDWCLSFTTTERWYAQLASEEQGLAVELAHSYEGEGAFCSSCGRGRAHAFHEAQEAMAGIPNE